MMIYSLIVNILILMPTAFAKKEIRNPLVVPALSSPNLDENSEKRDLEGAARHELDGTFAEFIQLFNMETYTSQSSSDNSGTFEEFAHNLTTTLPFILARLDDPLFYAQINSFHPEIISFYLDDKRSQGLPSNFLSSFKKRGEIIGGLQESSLFIVKAILKNFKKIQENIQLMQKNHGAKIWDEFINNKDYLKNYIHTKKEIVAHIINKCIPIVKYFMMDTRFIRDLKVLIGEANQNPALGDMIRKRTRSKQKFNNAIAQPISRPSIKT